VDKSYGCETPWLESSCPPGLLLEFHVFLHSPLSSAVSSRDSACCPCPLSLSLSLSLTLWTCLWASETQKDHISSVRRPDRFPSYLPSHTLYKAIGNSKLHLCPFVFLASCAFTEAKIWDIHRTSPSLAVYFFRGDVWFGISRLYSTGSETKSTSAFLVWSI